MASNKFRSPTGLSIPSIDFVDESNEVQISFVAANTGVVKVFSGNTSFYEFDPATTVNFTTADANDAIDARVTKSFVDALNVDANNALYLGGIQANSYALKTDLTNLSPTNVTIGDGVVLSTATVTTTNTDPQQLYSFDVNAYSSAKIKITATGITTGQRQITEIFVIHKINRVDSNTVFDMYTGIIPEGSYDVSLSNTDVVLTVTSSTDIERHYLASLELFASPNVNVTIPDTAALDRFGEPVYDRNGEYILVRA